MNAPLRPSRQQPPGGLGPSTPQTFARCSADTPGGAAADSARADQERGPFFLHHQVDASAQRAGVSPVGGGGSGRAGGSTGGGGGGRSGAGFSGGGFGGGTPLSAAQRVWAARVHATAGEFAKVGLLDFLTTRLLDF